MDEMELLLKLEKVNKIWTGYAYLELDDDGRPELSGWYDLNKSDKKSISVKYIIESINPLVWRKVV